MQTGAARGYYLAGEIPDAIARMQSALKSAALQSIYLFPAIIGRELAVMKAGIPPNEWQILVNDAFEVAVMHQKYDYEQLEQIEMVLLRLWENGEVEAISKMLQNSKISRSVRQDVCRSIWADIALSPDPLASLAGTWPAEALPKEVLTELMTSVIHSLKRMEHPAAAEVETMWERA